MAELRIGTCSWKYDSWKGLVYAQSNKNKYLGEYSNKFNTVEIDQWFWSLHGPQKVTLPKNDVVKSYALSVPEDFKFTIKVPNSITLTHYYNKSKKSPLEKNPYFFSEKLFSQFLKSLDPLRKFLGPLIFQFEYLNKKKMKSQFDFQIQLAAFCQKLKKDFSYAVEIRNPNYLNKEYFEFISENNLVHVFLEGYYMPAITDVYEKYKKEIKKTVVIRLHGPDRKGIEEKSGGIWNKILESKNSQILKIVQMIDDLLNRDIDIYLNVNNHYEGSAPLTINKIREHLNIPKH